MVEEKSVKWGYRALLIAGILLLAIGITFIFLGEYQDAYTETIGGLTFLKYLAQSSFLWKSYSDL